MRLATNTNESNQKQWYVYLSFVICNNNHIVIGFNPRWNETFTFKLHRPELALMRFCVMDHDTTSDDDFIGEYTIHVPSARTGI